MTAVMTSSPCPSLLLLNGLQQLEAVEADDAAGGRLRPLCDPIAVHRAAQRSPLSLARAVQFAQLPLRVPPVVSSGTGGI